MAQAGKPETATAPARSNGFYLLVLLALVVPLRAWLVYNTEVTARDSIGYIRYALSFEKHSWGKVLLDNHQHPGYPLSVYLASLPVRALSGPAEPNNMQWSAQLASNLAAVLLIVPMFFLGKAFFDARVAFWGTLLFQYLPVSGHHLSDGISEALFLLFVSLALWAVVSGMRRESWFWYAVGGGCCGLAYLTRPEGVMVVAATLLALAVRQAVPAWRRGWWSTCAAAVALLLATTAVGSLYFGFTHKFTNKPNIDVMATAILAELRTRREADAPPVPMASLFAASSYADRNSRLLGRLGKGFYILGAEMLQMFHYVGLIAVGLGMLWQLRRLTRVPEFYVPFVFVLLHTTLILTLVCTAGYLSDRHLLAIGLWWCYFAAAGLIELPVRAGRWFRWGTPTQVSLALLVAFVALCLPRTGQRIHGNRVGNHAAGLWLAENLQRGDVIEDDHSWSHYYSGLFFEEGKNKVLPSTCKPRCFWVMTRSQNNEKVAEQRWQEEGKLRKKGAIVYHWPTTSTQDDARIVVYSLPRNPKTHRWIVRD